MDCHKAYRVLIPGSTRPEKIFNLCLIDLDSQDDHLELIYMEFPGFLSFGDESNQKDRWVFIKLVEVEGEPSEQFFTDVTDEFLMNFQYHILLSLIDYFLNLYHDNVLFTNACQIITDLNGNIIRHRLVYN